MGMGVSEQVAQGAEYLLKNYMGKLLLDADGLNSLAKYCADSLRTLLREKKCEVVLTPHVKEFSRLSGLSVENVLQEGLTVATDFAKEMNVALLLKGASSIVTDGRSAVVVSTGNSGLAKGGSGDVLSGVIVGLCASGASAFDGAVCGSFLVGKAAELGALEKGEHSLTASDVISYLGGAFLSI
jgi:NAD(P)H-hydrate epimerase